MKTETANNIIKYILAKGRVSAKELVDHFGITRQALFKHHLPKLLKNGQINKIGKPPRVFYFIPEKVAKKEKSEIDTITRKIVEEHYLIITPSGEKKEGLDGFEYWCQKNNLDITKTAHDYVTTVKKFDRWRKDGLIDGLSKMRRTFPKVYLDKLFYLDFYSIERFGKTKLGQLLLYAKQSQNKQLMKELIAELKPRLRQAMKKYNIDAVGFIPPTVKREVQFMKELQKNLQLPTRTISIVKVTTAIVVPQKTLNKLPDRVENAKKTIIVRETIPVNNILLIDDAVGSGATLNETAAQLRTLGLVKNKIIGLSITGSFKGFDVISEV